MTMPPDDVALALQRAIDRFVRRLRRGSAPERTHRRLLIVQIDGLPRVVLERGLASGFASMLFSYLFLWTVNPGSWPPQDVQIPPLLWPAIAALVLAASGVVMAHANRALAAERQRGPWTMRSALILATLLMGASFGVALHDLWQSGLRPSQHAYGAMVYTVRAYQGLHVAVLLVMACYLLARSMCGLLDPVRRASF